MFDYEIGKVVQDLFRGLRKLSVSTLRKPRYNSLCFESNTFVLFFLFLASDFSLFLESGKGLIAAVFAGSLDL